MSYSKAPLIFEKISRTIGQDSFILGLKTFYEQFQFKIALLSDLQTTLEDVVDQSLDWLIFPWFDNDYLPKYKISDYNFDDNSYDLTITLEDQNEPINDYSYSQQVPIVVYNENGDIIFDSVVWLNSTTTLVLPMGGTPKKIRLIYGNDVLVQLTDASKPYLEKVLGEGVDVIPGYNFNILLIVSSLALIYLLYKLLNKKYI